MLSFFFFFFYFGASSSELEGIGSSPNRKYFSTPFILCVHEKL
jgi:hypothetical protein